ncbi:hypothetical protein EP30_06570 [Bifidobacterium sp. UTCIF-39]|nr:hypothetical protein EP30_06570 [Bifidobacterium sp. UTCIF-39]
MDILTFKFKVSTMMGNPHVPPLPGNEAYLPSAVPQNTAPQPQITSKMQLEFDRTGDRERNGRPDRVGK